MLKYIFIILFPFILVANETNIQSISKETNVEKTTKEKLLNTPDQNITYFTTYLQSSCFSYFHHGKFEGCTPTYGVGFRTHKNYHGFDGSVNLLFYQCCSTYYLPFLKFSYLNYPFYKKNNFFYWGITAANVIFIPYIPIPFATIGFESSPSKKFKIITQLDLNYKIAGFSLGIGF